MIIVVDLFLKKGMNKEQCPICYTPLEVTERTPCDDCGHLPHIREHFEEGISYRIYELYEGLKLQLCNFCALDFGSYKSEYLGFKNREHLGFEYFNFVAEVEAPSIQKGKYCPQCNQTKDFLVFLRNLREVIKK